MQKKLLGIITFILCFMLFTGAVKAQVIVTLQPMSFGTAVVGNNDSQHEIIINTDGTYSADPAFSIIIPPNEGRYLLTLGTPNALVTNINVNVDQQMNGVGEDFIIDNFTFSNPPQLSLAGDLNIEIGARLRTTGSGTNYSPANSFASIMTLDIIY